MSTSAHPNHVMKGNRRPGKGRGASNTNDRGNVTARRARKAWLLETYRASRDLYLKPIGESFPKEWGGFLGSHPGFGREMYLITLEGVWVDVPVGMGQAACRCYRCGCLLTIETMTVDKIFPKQDGGKYRSPPQDRKEKATNIRPACNDCNSETGAALASQSRGKT